MNKEELKNKKSALELLQNEAHDKLTDYKVQISLLDKELEDLGKPEATSEFLDKLNETITEEVEGLELDDGITCDLEIDYDNRITTDNFRFEDTHAISDKIYCAVEKLFAEISTEEIKQVLDDNSQLNIRGEGGNVRGYECDIITR